MSCTTSASALRFALSLPSPFTGTVSPVPCGSSLGVLSDSEFGAGCCLSSFLDKTNFRKKSCPPSDFVLASGFGSSLALSDILFTLLSLPITLPPLLAALGANDNAEAGFASGLAAALLGLSDVEAGTGFVVWSVMTIVASLKMKGSDRSNKIPTSC